MMEYTRGAYFSNAVVFDCFSSGEVCCLNQVITLAEHYELSEKTNLTLTIQGSGLASQQKREYLQFPHEILWRYPEFSRGMAFPPFQESERYLKIIINKTSFY